MQEIKEDPALFVIFSDEATLGRVIAANHSPVARYVGPPAAQYPNTRAMREWFQSLAVSHTDATQSQFTPDLWSNPAVVRCIGPNSRLLSVC